MSTLLLYIKYKRMKILNGSFIDGALQDKNGQVVLDAVGQTITKRLPGDRAWNDPKVPSWFGYAITALHKAAGHVGPYFETCSQ